MGPWAASSRPPARVPSPPHTNSENQLTSTLPAELGRLGALEDLQLGSNRLTGSIPPEWGGMGSLQRLYLL